MKKQYTVTIFSPTGEVVSKLNGLPRSVAAKIAKTRPRLGGSYIMLDDTVLKFKPYRRPRPPEYRLYESPNTRRLSAKQIEAAAANMRALA